MFIFYIKYIAMGQINIENIDCILGLKKMKDDSCDMIYVDAPFCMTDASWDQEGLNLEKLAQQLWRVAKERTPIIFSCNMKFHLKIAKAMGDKYFKFDMVWHKHNATNPFMARLRPMPCHEFLAFYYKKQPLIYYENVKKYHQHKEVPVCDIVRKRGSLYRGVNQPINKVKNTRKYNPRLPRSVIKVDKISKCHTRGVNPTEKPYDLLKFIVKYYTKEGDVVLDPTFGSCPMGSVCKDMKRNFVGFELDKKQYQHAHDRFFKKNKIKK